MFIQLMPIFIYLWIVELGTLFMYLISAKRGRAHIEKHVSQWSHMILVLARYLLGVRIKYNPAKVAQIPKHSIIISNHQSLLDILAILDAMRDLDPRFVAKKSLGHFLPAASRVLRMQPHLLINRKGSFASTMSAMKIFGRRAYKKGWSPVIFPEGTRSRTGEVQTFHTAGARMIMGETKLPIVIIAVDGGYQYSKLKDFRKKQEFEYQLQVIKVLDAPNSKKEISKVIEESRELIIEQIKIWRNQAQGKMGA